MADTAEALFLEKLDGIVGGTSKHARVTGPGERPPVYSVQYPDRPAEGWTTSATLGLSSVPNVEWDDGTGPELAIRMRSSDPAWGFAIAEIARKARGRMPICADLPIGFGAAVSEESPMSAFLLVEPRSLPSDVLCCADRHIVLLEALPLHASELAMVREHGSEWLLDQPVDFSDPLRPARRAG